VVALGTGMESRKRAVCKVLDIAIEKLGCYSHAEDVLTHLRDGYQPEHVCAVGDCVAFHPKDGQEIQVDGDSFIILREDDLIAIIEPVDDLEPAPV
jgi:chaperonin subunit